MQIINHLEDISIYNLEYTEDDKRIFSELEDLIKEAGYSIQYMNAPVDIIENNIITAISMKMRIDRKILSGKEIFDALIDYIKNNTEYNFINNYTIYIYKMGKLKCIKDDITFFVYTIRIGTYHKFN